MYSVDIVNIADYRFKVSSKDYELTVDTKGGGITPPDTLLASLGTCVGVYIRKYAEGAKLALEGFSIRVEAEFSKEQPVCFRSIKVLVDFKGAALDERRKAALIDFVENCPVHNTLKYNPRVEIEIAKESVNEERPFRAGF